MKDLKVAICFIAFSFLFTSISFSQKNDCAQVKEEVKYILEMPEAASYAAKVTERIIGNPDCFSEAETALLQGKLSKLIGSKVDLSPRNESTAKGPGIDTNAKGSTRPQTRPETKSETKPNSTVTANPVMRSEEKAVTRMAESKPTNGAVLNGSPETKSETKGSNLGAMLDTHSSKPETKSEGKPSGGSVLMGSPETKNGEGDNRNYGNDGIPVAPVAFLRVNEEALASAFYTTREQCKADMEPYAENMNDQELLAAIEQCVNSKTLENFNFIRTEEDVRVEDLNGGVSIAPTAFTSVSIVTVSEQEMRDNCKRSVEYKASNLNDAQVLKMIDLCVASQLLQTYHVGTTAIN